MRSKYTGEKAKHRKERQVARQGHIQALNDHEIIEALPEVLVPDVFSGIQETYWNCLRSVRDPRNPSQMVYPLYLILHRIISGFLSGNRYIGVLFPAKHRHVEAGKKKLGALPTRKVVYQVLQRIDWAEANDRLSPLWDCLGHTPDLVVRRKFRDTQSIRAQFRDECQAEDAMRRTRIHEDHEAEERSKGMSAAKAKRCGFSKKRLGKRSEISEPPKTDVVSRPLVAQRDLVIDGKVVKASYNAGAAERVVHVTEIKTDEMDTRSRYIIGAQPTVLDRNGEWGAALSILDALTPLTGDRVVVVSGDSGFCVEEFCNWLNKRGFFLPLPDKEKRG
jgi:hypothetical protein